MVKPPRATRMALAPALDQSSRPIARSSDQAPPPRTRKNSAQKPISSAYSEPPCVQKKPFAEVNFTPHDHEDDDCSRRKARKQSQHQQRAADQFGAPDQRAPEYAGREADSIEQRGVAGKAHAAECAEQLLHAVWNEDRAERDAQDRLGIFVDRAVNIAERGNVVMRCCFGHRHAPSMMLSLACA